ncbi:MAG: HNH endonuclease [Nitrososphaerales archaeon]
MTQTVRAPPKPDNPLQILTSGEIEEKSIAGLFTWTLTHSTPAFSEIRPIFRTRKDLSDYVFRKKENRFRKADVESISYKNPSSSEITEIALGKINKEWRAWVNVHQEFSIDEHKLDNMLMMVLYRFILDRDLKMCALCHATTDLTIHHIIQKRRNVRISAPPFGRSVPTNLMTLCRNCHAFFDPMILF